MKLYIPPNVVVELTREEISAIATLSRRYYRIFFYHNGKRIILSNLFLSRKAMYAIEDGKTYVVDPATGAMVRKEKK
jgi:hypothetical protein